MKMQTKRYSHAIHVCTRDRISSFRNVDWYALSSNPNITFEFVKDNFDKPWNWSYLSYNPNITWSIVKENIEKPWDICALSRNQNITFDIVKENPDKPWDWSYLSINPSITWDIVNANIERPWDLYHLSMNPNIKWNDVKENIDKPWNWSAICINPNMLKNDMIFIFFYLCFNNYKMQKKIKVKRYSRAIHECIRDRISSCRLVSSKLQSQHHLRVCQREYG
jgi:hypothetical protein